MPAGASGSPTSVLVTTSSASLPSAWPTWAPNISPPIRPMIPAIGPNDIAASCGSALVIAATTFSASGSISCAPGGQGLLHPVHPRPRRGPLDARRQLGDLVEPEVGQPQRLGDGGLLGLRRRLVAGGELADRALPGEVPVHRAARPAHHLLQLGEQRHLAQQVLRGAAAGDAAEQGAETERVARGVAALPGSRRSGSRSGSPKPNGTSLMRPR